MIEYRENETQKALFVDGVCQGVCLKDGTPDSPYMKPIVDLEKTIVGEQVCLFLGGGPMILQRHFIKKGHDCVTFENDDEMLNYAIEFSKDPAGTIHFESAFGFDRFSNEYGFILLDCYNGKDLAPGLYSKDFISRCKSSLTDEGYFVVNFCADDQHKYRDFESILKGLFKNVELKGFYADKETTKLIQGVYICHNTK